MSKLSVVVLAAGKGARMHSDLPKVLHQIAGKSLIHHVIDTISDLHAENVYVVCGHGMSKIEQALKGLHCHLILQSEQLGTGHAVKQVMPHLGDSDNVLILYADIPLITAETLKKLIAAKPKKGLSLLTANLDNPAGYGRMVRHQGKVTGIVEQKDATPDELKIHEVNTGILFAAAKELKSWLAKLTNNNAQNEYYLPDIVAIAHQKGYNIATIHPQINFEAQGVNTRNQLAELERIFQKNQVEQLLLSGVTLRDPKRFDLRGKLEHGHDVIIDTNVIIEGHVTLGNRVQIGSGSILKNCIIEDDAIISPYTFIEGAHLANRVTVGPFARLRPGCYLQEKTHVGNFVELKNTQLGCGSKVGHLTYLGDSDIGANVNIGAGTITCNYDGANKFKTVIADDVFVGSDTQFVAPVTVAKGATIGAGTTVTHDVGENELVISRVKQQHIQGWKKPAKQNK